jgi:hypothetical protein
VKPVVADSNVYVSALQFGGKPMALLTLAEEGQIDLAISKAILTETLGVLRVKFYTSEEQLAEREACLRAITRVGGSIPNCPSRRSCALYAAWHLCCRAALR